MHKWSLMDVHDNCGIHMSNSRKPLRFVNLECEVRDAAKKQLGQMHQTVRGFGNKKLRKAWEHKNMTFLKKDETSVLTCLESSNFAVNFIWFINQLPHYGNKNYGYI